MNYKSAPYGKRNSLAVIVIISLALGAVLGSYGTASLLERQNHRNPFSLSRGKVG